MKFVYVCLFCVKRSDNEALTAAASAIFDLSAKELKSRLAAAGVSHAHCTGVSVCHWHTHTFPVALYKNTLPVVAVFWLLMCQVKRGDSMQAT